MDTALRQSGWVAACVRVEQGSGSLQDMTRMRTISLKGYHSFVRLTHSHLAYLAVQMPLASHVIFG